MLPVPEGQPVEEQPSPRQGGRRTGPHCAQPARTAGSPGQIDRYRQIDRYKDTYTLIDLWVDSSILSYYYIILKNLK